MFVDTSAWYARFATRDAHHTAVRACFAENRTPLTTTDYVIDETLTLFNARGNAELAFRVGARLIAGDLASIEHVSADDIAAAWQLFDSHRDSMWSFTDCTSYVVMKRLNITEAIAADEHFQQFGFAVVRP